MAAFGAPADLINRTVEAESEEPEAFEVWEENWHTVMLFLSLTTQWRKEIPAMSAIQIWHGLDYQGVEATIRMMGLWHECRELFEGIQTMETEALKHLNKRAN